MLSVESLRSGYTAIDVLKGVALAVADNAIIGVLGPNGAGKTALLRAISGLNPVRGGRISFSGADITRASPDAVVRRGVIQVPQGRMLFGSMTVRENLELGAYLQTNRTAIEQRLALVHDMFPVLRERSGLEAAYLSGGEQQMLAIGRALMGNPRLLLLDEPSLGLAPKVFDTILERVCAIHAAGASILIAEQNARKVLRMAHHCYVLENGTVAFDAPASELLHDPRIEKTYLGAGH
ncbi:MAG TPA: ABC transporter ATP-binding protein [Casimicrobiaceae bacterium]|jgi:branched-chain amino acid transport system ATP-binding protein|nr:ABC transporter ATP-binding protein [Casimicrobiaceae bacterium]